MIQLRTFSPSVLAIQGPHISIRSSIRRDSARPLKVCFGSFTYVYVKPTYFIAVAQLPQTAYQSLLTPYAYFGLGRTNNYIENLFVGSTLKTQSSSPSDHYIDMEGVIPNSKVVIYPPAGANGDGSWRRELYLRPGAWIPWVTLTVVATTVVLAIIVFVLHLNEKVRHIFLLRSYITHDIAERG